VCWIWQINEGMQNSYEKPRSLKDFIDDWFGAFLLFE
jgi:hypothetical protein